MVNYFFLDPTQHLCSIDYLLLKGSSIIVKALRSTKNPDQIPSHSQQCDLEQVF